STGAGFKRHHVAGCIAAECQARIRSQHPAAGRSLAELVPPPDLTRLIVNREQGSFAPGECVFASPTVGALILFAVIHTPARTRADEIKAGLRIEAGRAVIRESGGIRLY